MILLIPIWSDFVVSKNLGLIVVVSISLTAGSLFGQASNTQRGAAAGVTAGAILGGVIGNQNDETIEGVLIGGAVGAVAGGLLGNQKDKFQQQVAHQRAVDYSQGVSFNDVVHLTQNGVGPTVIINQIRNYGVKQRIGVNEIIGLHQSGVDKLVISEMQNARLAGVSVPVPVAPARVVTGPSVIKATVVAPRLPSYKRYVPVPVRPPYRNGYHRRPGPHRGGHRLYYR